MDLIKKTIHWSDLRLLFKIIFIGIYFSFFAQAHVGFFSPGIGTWTYSEDLGSRVSKFPDDSIALLENQKAQVQSLINKSLLNDSFDGIFVTNAYVLIDSSDNFHPVSENIFGLIFPNYVLFKDRETTFRLLAKGLGDCAEQLRFRNILYPPHNYSFDIPCYRGNLEEIKELAYIKIFFEIRKGQTNDARYVVQNRI